MDTGSSSVQRPASSPPPFFQDLTTADWVVVVIVAIAALLSVPYVMFGSSWIGDFGKLKVEEKAAVFQAISSVVAIVAGAGAIYWQVGRQRAAARESERAEQLRRLTLLSGSIFWCRVTCARLIDVSESGLPVDSEVAELKEQCAALRAIPALEMPDWSSSYGVAQAVRGFLAHEAKLKPEDDRLSVRLIDERMRWAASIAHGFDHAEELIERSLKDLGGKLPGISYLTASLMGGKTISVVQGER